MFRWSLSAPEERSLLDRHCLINGVAPGPGCSEVGAPPLGCLGEIVLFFPLVVLVALGWASSLPWVTTLVLATWELVPVLLISPVAFSGGLDLLCRKGRKGIKCVVLSWQVKCINSLCFWVCTVRHKGLDLVIMRDANRSISGENFSFLQDFRNKFLLRHHSVHLLEVRDSRSATMFSRPGIRATVSQICLLMHQSHPKEQK